MSAQSEQLYSELNTERDLVALIGQPEDANLDCKVWPVRTDDRRRVLAKAVCGFTNATGGVVILGMFAKGGRPGDDIPDAVQSCEPIADRDAAVSEALDIILKFVEPGIAGIERKTIAHNNSDKEGYVVIHVPESESTPRRTKTDWKFYVRITSGTLPMEYFQIEDRFGRRPHPKLVLELLPGVIGPASYPFHGNGVQRTVQLLVRNDGRGIARFPCVRCRNNSTFRIQNHPLSTHRNPPWPVQTLGEWTSVRGSISDVIYPGELFAVATLAQFAQVRDFEAADLEVELLCDDMPPHRQTFSFEASTYKKP